METAMPLIERLKDEKLHKISGGIYNKMQVDMAYNSNHMEGSRITHEQTRYIYETHTLESDIPVNIDDVTETVNHFRCFDYVLDHYDDPLSEDFIKHLHYLLKNNTFSSQSKEAVVGNYKFLPNYVDEIQTSRPEDVHKNMTALLTEYNRKKKASFDDVLGFHADFEHIHPFYDGNGRVGRLVMFRECLRNNIVPFIIMDEYKPYYIRGLHEWQTGGEKGYLRDTCLLMQDNMKKVLEYFQIPYDTDDSSCNQESQSGVREKDDKDKMTPAESIIFMRKQTGLSQARFAAVFDIPVAALQDWEHGRRTPPSYVLKMMQTILNYRKEQTTLM